MPRESSPKRRKAPARASDESAESPLAGLLSERTLRGLSDPKSYERGTGYAAEARVVNLTQYRGELLAVVRGTHDYQVKLWARGDRVLSSCTCPAWGGGRFCKHCVAVGLVAAKRLGAEPSLDDVERHLATLDPAFLASVLTGIAVEDVRLRERLYLGLARARASDAAAVREAYRSALSRIRAGAELLGYEGAADFAYALEGVVDAIEDLLREQPSFAVGELAAEAAAVAEEALNWVDDYEGYVGQVVYRLERIR